MNHEIKNIIRLAIIIAVIFVAAGFLTACGGGGSSSPKPFNSVWMSEDGFRLDLTGSAPGTVSTIGFFFEDGGICECRLRVIGGPDQGDYILNSCEFDYSSSPDYLACYTLNHSGEYSIENNILMLCDPDGCEVFQ